MDRREYPSRSKTRAAARRYRSDAQERNRGQMRRFECVVGLAAATLLVTFMVCASLHRNSATRAWVQARGGHQGAALPGRGLPLRFRWVPVDPADVRKVILRSHPAPSISDDKAALRGRPCSVPGRATGRHNVARPRPAGRKGPTLEFLMYPQAETAEGRPTASIPIRSPTRSRPRK